MVGLEGATSEKTGLGGGMSRSNINSEPISPNYYFLSLVFCKRRDATWDSKLRSVVEADTKVGCHATRPTSVREGANTVGLTSSKKKTKEEEDYKTNSNKNGGDTRCGSKKKRIGRSAVYS